MTPTPTADEIRSALAAVKDGLSAEDAPPAADTAARVRRGIDHGPARHRTWCWRRARFIRSEP